MSSFLEHVTHISVLAFYIAAFVMALIAHLKSRLWARRVSTVAMMCAAGFWIFFYIFIVEVWQIGDTPVHTSVLWSRIGHYITATGLFTMAFVIRRSEKYGLRELFMTDEDT